MKISYAIPVCNEHFELSRLLDTIAPVLNGDEIVIMVDEPNATQEVLDLLENTSKVHRKDNFKVYYDSLDGDFGEFKNKLNSKCTGDYIFQIDADEIPSVGLRGSWLHRLIAENPKTDLFMVPRINTIDYGDRFDEFMEYCNEQGWMITEMDDHEVGHNKYWINYPDNQARIYKNLPEIEWRGKVHESIVGAKTYTILSGEMSAGFIEGFFHLEHSKSFERQKKQNKLYDEIID